MFKTIQNFFRKRKIRKFSKAIPTELLPISEISTANIVIDVEEPEWDLLKEDILSWGRNSGIKVNIYFFDFRKLGKNELLLTSIQTTVARKDLNWLGMPVYEKVAGIIEEQSDLFISLINNGDFPIDFMSKCASARFKIGRKAYPEHCFDMICASKQADGFRTNGRLVFSGIVEFLEKISK